VIGIVRGLHGPLGVASVVGHGTRFLAVSQKALQLAQVPQLAQLAQTCTRRSCFGTYDFASSSADLRFVFARENGIVLALRRFAGRDRPCTVKECVR
jgi:hypothetical protein